MLDVKILRDRAAEVAAIYRDQLFDEGAVALMNQVAALDGRRRQLLGTADELKARRNSASQVIGKEKDPERRAALINEMESVNHDIAGLDEKLRTVETELETLAHQLPKIPAEGVPIGKGDADNVVLRQEGQP